MARNKMPAPFPVGRVRVRVEKQRSPEPDDQGRWYWRAEVTENKRRRCVWCGWASPDEAERAVADLVAKGLPEEEKTKKNAADKPMVTVNDLLNAWVDHTAEDPDTKDSTKRSYRGTAERLCFDKHGSGKEEEWTVRPIAAVKLSALSEKTIEDHRRRRLKQGAAPLTVRQEVSVFYAAVEWGHRYGHLERGLYRIRTSAEPVRPKPTPERGENALIYAQMQQMLAAGTFRQEWPLLAFLLFLASGARLAEVAHLRPEDVTWESDGSMRLNLWESKTDPRQVIVSDPYVCAEVKRWLARPPNPRRYAHHPQWLLGVKPNTVRCAYRDDYLKPACAAINAREDLHVEIPIYTPHAQRRHASREMMRAGCDDMTFKAVLGQSKRMAEKSYTQAADTDRRKAATALEGFTPTVLPFRQASGGKR